MADITFCILERAAVTATLAFLAQRIQW